MKAGSRISDGLRRTAWAACLALAVFTLYCVFFRAHGLNRKEFDFSNLVYAGCGAALMLAAYALTRWWNRVRHDRMVIALGCVALFVLQRCITHLVIFGTGWDAVDVVNFAWRIASGGECTDWENLYLSNYTNNELMILLYAACIRLRMLFGAELVRRDVLLTLTVLNSLVSSVGAYLVYRCVQMVSREKRTALLAWLAYCALIGLSPWFLIPYSDSLALFFPVLILYVYLNKRIWRGKWPMIGALSYLGFQIKPSVAIVLIAIAILETLDAMRRGKTGAFVRRLSAVLAVMLALHAGYMAIPTERVGWKIDPQKRMVITHYLMMGLNEENLGGYLEADVNYSCSFPTVEQRKKANLAAAAERLKAMGPAGYMSFLADKNAVNFHDGTFAWGKEGGFMRVIFDVEETRPIRILRSVFYPDGDRHHHLMNVLQLLWMGTLLGHAFALLDGRAGKKELLVMHLCVAGITLFTLIFESRARYLYVFVPVIIVAASLGYECAAKRIGRLMNRTSKSGNV